jgi:hypothetical protein
MKTTPTNFASPKADSIGYGRATCDAPNRPAIVPNLYLTLASCHYDGLDQHLAATATNALPAPFCLASGTQMIADLAVQTAGLNAANPINGVDPTGTTRHIFAFEGLGGYDQGAWESWNKNNSVGAGLVGHVLRDIFGNRAGNAGGIVGGASRSGGPDWIAHRDDTVLHYFGWSKRDIDYAVRTARGLFPEEPRGKSCYYDTIVVIGHSFGGNAAWEFTQQLYTATNHKAKVDLVYTFDARNPVYQQNPNQGITKNALARPFDGAIQSYNAWHRGIPDSNFFHAFDFTGSPFGSDTANASGVPLNIEKKGANHFSVVSRSYDDVWAKLNGIAPLRTDPINPQYVWMK